MLVLLLMAQLQLSHINIQRKAGDFVEDQKIEELAAPSVSKVETTSTVVQTGDNVNATDSSIFGLSVRAIICMMFSGTICAMFLMGRGQFVEEPLYGLGYLAVGYFFGQKGNKS